MTLLPKQRELVERDRLARLRVAEEEKAQFGRLAEVLKPDPGEWRMSCCGAPLSADNPTRTFYHRHYRGDGEPCWPALGCARLYARVSGLNRRSYLKRDPDKIKEWRRQNREHLLAYNKKRYREQKARGER